MTTTRFADLVLDGSLNASGLITSLGAAGGYSVTRRDTNAVVMLMYATSDTKMRWSNGSSDVMTLSNAGALALSGGISGTTAAFTDNLSVATGKKLSLNVGLTTYIMEIAANEMVFVAGGSQFLRFQAPGVLVIGGSMATTNSNAGNVLLQDASAPSGNPTGGIFVWSQGGAGKARGTSGTVTTWAPAEPHCPVCGSDFGHEWSNPKFGGTLQICMKCLVADLAPNKPYVRLLGAA